jgi:hypothetical protein
VTTYAALAKQFIVRLASLKGGPLPLRAVGYYMGDLDSLVDDLEAGDVPVPPCAFVKFDREDMHEEGALTEDRSGLHWAVIVIAENLRSSYDAAVAAPDAALAILFAVRRAVVNFIPAGCDTPVRWGGAQSLWESKKRNCCVYLGRFFHEAQICDEPTFAPPITSVQSTAAVDGRRFFQRTDKMPEGK